MLRSSGVIMLVKHFIKYLESARMMNLLLWLHSKGTGVRKQVITSWLIYSILGSHCLLRNRGLRCLKLFALYGIFWNPWVLMSGWSYIVCTEIGHDWLFIMGILWFIIMRFVDFCLNFPHSFINQSLNMFRIIFFGNCRCRSTLCIGATCIK